MRLHYAPGTIAGAVAIALHEAKIPFDLVLVDFSASAQRSPAFLKVNPKGRVPALETPQGILTETAAILDYIAAISPEAGLVPDSAFEAAQMRGIMGYLNGTFHVAHAHKHRGHRWAKTQSTLDELTAMVPETMTACSAYLEAELPLAPFAMGAAHSLADPYLYAATEWLPGYGVDLRAFPKLSAFRQFYSTRPAVQAAIQQGILG